jgi:hypothetical protein
VIVKALTATAKASLQADGRWSVSRDDTVVSAT